MSERAQALEQANYFLDAIDEIATIGAAPKHHTGQSAMPPPYNMTPSTAKNIKWNTREIRSKLALLASAAPPVGVSPQPDTALKEAVTWVLNVVSGVGRAGGEPEPNEGQAAFQALADALSTPDAQVCVWREGEWDYESGCRGTQISRDERSSGPPDGWKHCPYCGKRLEVGTAPQGGRP